MTDLLIATCCLLQVVRNLDAKRKSLVEAGLKVDTFGLVVRCHSQGNWEHTCEIPSFFSNFLHVDLNITFLFDLFFFLDYERKFILTNWLFYSNILQCSIVGRIERAELERECHGGRCPSAT